MARKSERFWSSEDLHCEMKKENYRIKATKLIKVIRFQRRRGCNWMAGASNHD